jgi:hypothetical protein
MTDQSTPLVTPVAREALALALRQIDLMTQVEIAEALCVSASTISRFVSAELPRAISILCAAGITLVPCGSEIVDSDELTALESMARKYLEHRISLRREP